MQLRTLFALGLAALAPMALVSTACSSGSEGDDVAAGDESELKKSSGLEGSACSFTSVCKSGLVCHYPSSGPPPGTMGMPAPGGGGGGPPPGALGMPAQRIGKCEKPDPGEKGGTCTRYIPCDPGLSCDYTGASVPPIPPGRMGMPAPPQGICK